MEIIVENEQQLIKIGEKIGSLLDKSSVILLDGPLGSGKTTITKGIALGLGIKKMISSPTFTISKIYQGRLTLNHLDIYRLENLKEDIGLEDYLDDNQVVVIEWSKFLNDDIFLEYLHIELDYYDKGRILKFSYSGDYYQKLVEELVC